MITGMAKWFAIHRGNGKYTVTRLNLKVAEYLTTLQITVNGPFRTRKIARRYGHLGNRFKAPRAEDCDHEWVVFSTALQEVCLMVECAKCGAFGTVDDPSADEWRMAARASSRPYGWGARERVTFRGTPGLRHVERAP